MTVDVTVTPASVVEVEMAQYGLRGPQGIQGIQGIQGPAGPSELPTIYYDFGGATLPYGVTSDNITTSSSDNGTTTTLTATSEDPQLLLTVALAPSACYLITAKIKYVSGTMDGTLFYSNTNHGYTPGNCASFTIQPIAGIWQQVTIDMRNVADYMTGGEITQIRMDIGGSSGSVVVIDRVLIGVNVMSQGISAERVAGYFFRSCALSGGNNPAGGKYAGSASAVERRSLSVPSMLVNVGGSALLLAEGVSLDLESVQCWDSGTFTTAANRAGRDFYLFACAPIHGTTPEFVLSAQSTLPSAIPSGATPTVGNSRKIGGFHCLCVAVGSIGGHDLSGYLAGDVLPRSVWDLDFRPMSLPEGMVFGRHGQWVDIYLPSVLGDELVSVNGGTIADGTSQVKFHAYKFDQWFGRIAKKPIASLEFVAASLGANQGTNIAGGADPVTTGGHSDSAGRRMISNIGCEDMCGVVRQWGREQGGGYSGASGVGYDVNDSGVGGYHSYPPVRAGFGGYWAEGVYCGSRNSLWGQSVLMLIAFYSSRGVSEMACSRV